MGIGLPDGGGRVYAESYALIDATWLVCHDNSNFYVKTTSGIVIGLGNHDETPHNSDHDAFNLTARFWKRIEAWDRDTSQ